MYTFKEKYKINLSKYGEFANDLTILGREENYLFITNGSVDSEKNTPIYVLNLITEELRLLLKCHLVHQYSVAINGNYIVIGNRTDISIINYKTGEILLNETIRQVESNAKLQVVFIDKHRILIFDNRYRLLYIYFLITLIGL